VVVVVALYVLGNSTGGKNPATTSSNTTPPVKRHHHHPRHHATGTNTTTTPAAPTNVKLQLVPTGTVYVCLEDGRGRPLIRGETFAAGQTIPTFTRNKLLLTLGNALVKMKVNGKPTTVSPSSSAIGYTILPTGVTPLPASKQPTCA
jgi:hypothetical protein